MICTRATIRNQIHSVINNSQVQEVFPLLPPTVRAGTDSSTPMSLIRYKQRFTENQWMVLLLHKHNRLPNYPAQKLEPSNACTCPRKQNLIQFNNWCYVFFRWDHNKTWTDWVMIQLTAYYSNFNYILAPYFLPKHYL